MKLTIIAIIAAGFLLMSSKQVLARGYRNNNPGNIKKTADQWQGLASVQSDPVFFQFVSAEYGIRALTKIILTYMNVHKLTSINQIISRYAPGTENDTQSYINFVAARVGVPGHIPLDWFEIPKLVEAIILFENGYIFYSAETMAAGFEMAGVTV